MPAPQIDATLRQELLNQVLRGAAAPALTGPFVVSLHTGDPGTNRANEVSAAVWTNYARATVARSTAQWSAAANAGGNLEESANAADVDFGTAAVTGTPPVVAYVEVWDSSGTPRRVGGKVLDVAKTINDGDPVTIPAGSLGIGLDSA